MSKLRKRRKRSGAQAKSASPRGQSGQQISPSRLISPERLSDNGSPRTFAYRSELYSYVNADLKRILTIAIPLFLVLIILYLIL